MNVHEDQRVCVCMCMFVMFFLFFDAFQLSYLQIMRQNKSVALHQLVFDKHEHFCFVRAHKTEKQVTSNNHNTTLTITLANTFFFFFVDLFHCPIFHFKLIEFSQFVFFQNFSIWFFYAVFHIVKLIIVFKIIMILSMLMQIR